MTIPAGPESVDTSWEHYVRRFYAQAPAQRDADWAALTPEQQTAFLAARERVDRLVHVGGSGTEEIKTVAKVVAVLAAVLFVVMLVGAITSPPKRHAQSLDWYTPTGDEYIHTARGLVRQGATGCGEYKVRKSASGGYDVRCNDGTRTRRYSVGD